MESILEGINKLSIANSSNANLTITKKEGQIPKEESIKDEKKKKKKKIKKKNKNKSKENVTQTVAFKPMHEVYVDYLVQWLQENKIGKVSISG